MTAGLWAVGLFHSMVVGLALSEAGDLLSLPIRNDDSAAHFYAAVHAAEHWRAAATLWGYDAGWMAGYPEGVVSLVDNKLFQVMVWLAPESWEAAAYNTGFVLALLSPPWLLYAAARTAGHSSTAATGAALAGLIASFTIPLTMGFLVWGAVSYFLSAVLVVLTTVLLANAIAADRLWRARGVAALTLAFLVTFIHPAVVPALGAGLLPAIVIARRRPWRLALALALVGAAVAIAVFPLVEAYAELRRGPLSSIDPQGSFQRGGFSQLKDDWWTRLLKIDGSPYGAGGLLALLLLALCAGRARKSESAVAPDPRLARRVVLCAAGACVAMAYGAATVLPRAADLQPHRFIVVLGFFLCLPAGEGLARQVDEVRERRLASWPLGLAALAVAAHAGLGLGPLLVFGVGWDPAEEALVELLERDGDGGGRTLVESSLAKLPAAPGAQREISIKRFALLPLRTGGEFLGYTGTGPITVQRYAKFSEGALFGRSLADLDEVEAEILLRRYAITRVVACSRHTLRALRRLAAIVDQRERLGDCWAFRLREPEPSRFLEGRGQARARLDAIEVRGAEGERIVLKYHWLPTLRTEPPLPIEEAPQPGAPVGFIAVRPGGRRNFDVVRAHPRGRLALFAEAIRGLLER